jgi:hypothetical protein
MFVLRQTLFRVWDVFLMDGLDVLFRIALGILRSNEAELLRCESVPAVYVSLENLPTRMWEADKLLQVGIFSVTFFKLATIPLIFFIYHSSWKQTFEVHLFIHKLLENANHMSHRSVNSFLRSICIKKTFFRVYYYYSSNVQKKKQFFLLLLVVWTKL